MGGTTGCAWEKGVGGRRAAWGYKDVRLDGGFERTVHVWLGSSTGLGHAR